MEGCYFHYVKKLWSYAKKLSLRKKIHPIKLNLLFFVLKYIPILKKKKKNKFLSKIKIILKMSIINSKIFSIILSKIRKIIIY